jgi:hypothetical protein
MAKKLKPIHPGEILREEFMQPSCARDLCAARAHQRDRERQAWHYRRYGVKTGALFQCVAGDLDGLTDGV